MIAEDDVHVRVGVVEVVFRLEGLTHQLLRRPIVVHRAGACLQHVFPDIVP